MSIEDAIGELQWHCLTVNSENSSKIYVTCLKTVCSGSMQTVVKLINILLKHSRRNIKIVLPYTSVNLTVHDIDAFRLVLSCEVPFIESSLFQYKNNFKELDEIFISILTLVNIQNASSSNLFKSLNHILKILGEDVSLYYLGKFILTADNVHKSITNNYRKPVEDAIKTGILILPIKSACILLNFYLLKLENGDDINCFVMAQLIKVTERNYLVQKYGLLIDFVFDGFDSNIDSFRRSVVYAALLNHMDYLEWETNVLNKIKIHVNSTRSELFIQSFCNYMLPTTIKRFPNSLLKLFDVSGKLIPVLVHFGLKNSLVNGKDFLLTILNCINHFDEHTSLLGLQMLLMIRNSRVEVTNVYYDYIKSFLEQRLLMPEDIIQITVYLKIFHSHVIVSTNKKLNQNSEIDWNIMITYFDYLLEYCLNNMKEMNAVKNDIAFKIFYEICELFMDDSSKLKTQYALSRNTQYSALQCTMYKTLLYQKKWKFTSKQTLDRIVQHYFVNGYSGTIFEKLLLKFFKLDKETINVIFSKALEFLNWSNMLNTSKGSSLYYIYIAYKISKKESINEDIDYVMNTLRNITKVNLSAENLPMNPILAVIKTINKLEENNLLKSNVNYYELLNLFFDMLEHFLSQDDEISLHKGSISTKIIESVFTESMSFLRNSITKNSDCNYLTHTMYSCTQIIRVSSMRRPVTMAAVTLEYLCRHIVQTGYENECIPFIFEILDETLFSTLLSSDKASTIRRNPEARLIIQSLCNANVLPGKPIVQRTMRCLINIVNNRASSEASVASALNCLETLVSENDLKESTSEYVEEVAVLCVETFSNAPWMIKNATIQVWDAIIVRLLGQNAHVHNTRKSIEEIISAHPKLISYFYRKITSSDLLVIDESAVLILILFSQAHKKNNIFSKQIPKIIEAFCKLFIYLIVNQSEKFGPYAIETFVALHDQNQIPVILQDLVQYLCIKFDTIKNNSLFLLVNLLRSLYYKFLMINRNKLQFSKVQSILEHFRLFLSTKQHFRYTLFPIMSLNCDSIEMLTQEIPKILALPKLHFNYRIWLYTNIPFAVDHMNIEHLPEFLHTCLKFQVPEYLQLSLLKATLQRFEHNSYLWKDDTLESIIFVLVEKLIDLKCECDYLIVSYSELIFFLYEYTEKLSVPNDLLLLIRSSYEKKLPLRTQTVLVTVLANTANITERDNMFLKSVLTEYKVTVTENKDAQRHLASSLIHLYRSLKGNCRYDILKIAVHFLLKEETSKDICKFVSNIYKREIMNCSNSMKMLLNFHFLLQNFEKVELVYNFLVDISLYILHIPQEYKNTDDSFYLVEDQIITIRRKVVYDILITSFADYFHCAFNIG